MPRRGRMFNRCGACDGEGIGVVKITATDVDGHVLDTTWFCATCAPAMADAAWLSLGNVTTLRTDLQRLEKERS